MSRGQSSAAFGKLTEVIKREMDEPTKEGVTTLAGIAGVPLAEYIRNLLQCHVHGHLAVIRRRVTGRE